MPPLRAILAGSSLRSPGCRRALVALAILAFGVPAFPSRGAVPWRRILDQPDPWYATAEAAEVARQVLLFQRADGGWPKNLDMARPLDPAERQEILEARPRVTDSTLDNGATTTQLRFLARLHAAQPDPGWREAVERGLDWILDAQYANGGWPQFPHGRGYQRHITFNDGAMVNALRVLRDVDAAREPLGFLDDSRRTRARAAVERGIECILRTQVVVDGRPTVWCAQHDAATLRPAPARSYELESLSGGESVGIVRFLLEIERPSPAVAAAVEAAVAWFQRAQLTGLRLERRPAPALPRGFDTVVVPDPAAPPLWARFYEIATTRPFFCGRDGVKKASLAEIEVERRTGYAWYTDAPAALLRKDYPAWKARLAALGPPPEPTAQAHAGIRFGLVTVDPAGWRASFPARVNQTNGLVEYALVTDYGKTHESVLVTEAQPRDIQAALLLLRATPAGTNGLALPPGTVPLPSAVDLFVRRPGDDAASARPLDELIALTAAGPDPGPGPGGTVTGRLAPGPWLFNGSLFTQEGFAAHFEGSIVALIRDPSAILNNPRPDRDDDEIHIVAPGALPPPGTAVAVEMRVWRPAPP